MEETRVPVYLITGFLESGKTSFLSFTLQQDYFQIDGKTLLILCEEGEEEYSKEYLEAGKTEKAHEALRYGAEILAGTCVDILERPELLSEIQTEFRERKQKEKDVSF